VTLAGAGGFGVDLFFALSAFLITSLLLREIEQRGALDVKGFYLRRALRIWPLYFGFLTAGFALQFVAATDPLSVADFAAFLTFVGNWKIAATGYPAAAFALLWSLCVEEQFYLLWPPVLSAARKAPLASLAVGMIVLAVAARLIFGWLRLPDYALWCATITRLDPLAIGILVAAGWRPLARTPLVALTAGAATMVLGSWLSSLAPFGPAPGYLVVALGCGLVLSGTLAIQIRPRLLAYLGKISFGLYVYHRSIVESVDHYLPVHSAALQLARAGLALGVTIAVSALSYRLYEAPFLRLKERFAHVQSRPV
jgi:peptidoglycan/LPS O-acetylase OafA/YrhL